MGHHTLVMGNNVDNNKLDNNNFDNQDGFDISKYKGEKLVILDVFGTIICISKGIAWAFVPRDVIEHLRTNPIDYTKTTDSNQTKSKRLEINVDGVNWPVPKWVIEQTKKEIKEAFLYPDFYSPITIKRCNDGAVKLVVDEENEKVEEGEKIEHYDNIVEFLKHEGYRVSIASVLPQPYEQAVKNLIKEGVFDFKFYSCDIRKQKIDPEFYEYIKEVTGIDYDKMVMVGDSIKSDIVGANNKGIKTVYLDRKYKGPPKKIHLKRHGIDTTTIGTLAQLVEVL